jgi:hypothetical protein
MRGILHCVIPRQRQAKFNLKTTVALRSLETPQMTSGLTVRVPSSQESRNPFIFFQPEGGNNTHFLNAVTLILTANL